MLSSQDGTHLCVGYMERTLAPALKNLPRSQAGRIWSCAPHDVLTHLGDKWTILVVLFLARAPDNRARFSEIKRGVDGISQRMLTLTLRMLERNGLVTRNYFAEVPPRVEYEMSDMGRSMLGPLQAFAGWIEENWQTMERARKSFDASAGGVS